MHRLGHHPVLCITHTAGQPICADAGVAGELGHCYLRVQTQFSNPLSPLVACGSVLCPRNVRPEDGYRRDIVCNGSTSDGAELPNSALKQLILIS